MQGRDILKAGDPVLQSCAQAVENFGSKELYELVAFLFDQMDHHQGAGLAAPQVGEAKRVFVYGIENNPRYPDAKPIAKTVLINPEIYYLSPEKEEAYEGCLSFPKLRGLVSRSSTLKYKAYTLEGKLIEREVFGFEARVIQHENDHLNGILFPSRMADMSTFKYSVN